MSESVHKPFTSAVSVLYSLSGVLDLSPVVFRSQTFWGLISLVHVPRVRVLAGGVTPLAPREKLPLCQSARDWGLLHWGGVLGKTTPLPLLPTSLWPFLLCGGASFQVFLRGSFLYLPVDPECLWKELSSRSFYASILDCLQLSVLKGEIFFLTLWTTYS